jgi:hypothetical protein
MVGGDFNMLRYVHEKSNVSDYTIWMDMFNSFIIDTALTEIIRWGTRFTWINKQANPIGSILDRVFISKEWEQKFPKVKVSILTRVGSNYCPLLLDDDAKLDQPKMGVYI